MTPTTLPSAGNIIINHPPVIHNGPALLALFAMALVAGLTGGAIVGLLFYAKVKIPWP